METAVHTKPKLAFAGVGWIGRNRLQAAVESGLADIILLSDPSEQCLTEAVKIVTDVKISTSFNDVINDPLAEGVVIATPSALHKEQAVQAFQKGKAVFCQKPLGRNSEEVKAVIEAAREANKLLGADFSYRYTAAFQKILAVIHSGELGKIFAVDLKFHNAYGPDKPWFYDKQLSGGGCVLDLGIHLIDLMLVALDFPEVQEVKSILSAKGNMITGEQEVEDFATALLTLENDTSVQLACSWNLPAGCEAIIEASFYGTKGGVAMKNVAGTFYDFTAERYWGTKTETLVSPPDAWGGRALIHWIKKLSDNDTFNTDAEQYLQSALIVDKIYGRM